MTIINVYCPRVDPEKPERRRFKLRFYELLRQRAAAVWATDSNVVVLGDINCSHKRIDHCDPDESEVSTESEDCVFELSVYGIHGIDFTML